MVVDPLGITDSFDSLLGGIGSGLSDSIIGGVLSALEIALGKLLYYITAAVMYLVSLMQSLFSVFAGIVKVQNNGTKQYLINVFFSNRAINNVYWAMVLLAGTFVIAFTIVAVIRKVFDLNDKRQNQSLGSILGSMFKSILIMLLLTVIMSASISLTNEVIDRVSYIFDYADSFDKEDHIEFTDEQFATMARIYRVIGNYSLNPSYASRYNLNSCYNELRPDLQLLQQQGVFDMVYLTKDPVTGATVDTWQSALQELAYAADVNYELNINVYHEGVSDALVHIMDLLKTDKDFFPLEKYERSFSSGSTVNLDRVLFLTGTTSAARNKSFNVEPYMTDGLRGAFFSGEKSIYSFSEVNEAFDTGLMGINYLMIIVLAYFTLRNLLRCIFGCISRIINMVSLYIIAPLAVATMPLDDGEKFKQWTTSMIVQGLVIFGNIIPMRLVIMFAPMILGSELVLFESVSLNFIAKALLVVGSLQAVEGFSQIVTGILANSAGQAAVLAGDKMRGFSDAAFGKGVGAAGAAVKFGAKAAGYAAVGGLAAAGVTAGVGLAAGGLAAGGVGAGVYHLGRAVFGGKSDKQENKENGDTPGDGKTDTPKSETPNATNTQNLNNMNTEKDTQSTAQTNEQTDTTSNGNKTPPHTQTTIQNYGNLGNKE